MFRTMAAAAVLLAAGPRLAQQVTPPEGLTWFVVTTLNQADFDIDDPTNRPPLVAQPPEGVLIPVEVDGDGRTDWLIRWPERTAFCGTGGCRRTLYIGREDGLVRAFDRQALDLTLTTVEGEGRIEAWLHPLNCDDGREPCLAAWAWDEEAGRLAPRPSSDGAAPAAPTLAVIDPTAD